MAVHESLTSGEAVSTQASEASANVYADGLFAGAAGAAAIALWFLVVDLLEGRPFYTPNVLGTALFGNMPVDPTGLPVSFEMVVTFTWVHVLAFLIIGVAASRLLLLAERHPSFGFGILLLFVVFEFGFLLACTVLAEPVLQALAWPAVLIGNLLAAGAMAAVFWRRHPRLVISP